MCLPKKSVFPEKSVSPAINSPPEKVFFYENLSPAKKSVSPEKCVFPEKRVIPLKPFFRGGREINCPSKIVFIHEE